MATFNSLTAYCVYLKEFVRKSACVRNPETILLARDKKNPREGRVYAEGLVLKAGGTIRFHEHLVLSDDGEISRLLYAYGYEDKKIGFRYDREPEKFVPVVHEVCHLHVNGMYAPSGAELRFKTHETSFEEVFAFIATCIVT